MLTSYEPDVHYSDIQFRVHDAREVHGGARYRRQVVDSNANQSSISSPRDNNTSVTPSSTTAAPSSRSTTSAIQSTSTTVPPTSTDPYFPVEVSTVPIVSNVKTASSRWEFLPPAPEGCGKVIFFIPVCPPGVGGVPPIQVLSGGTPVLSEQGGSPQTGQGVHPWQDRGVPPCKELGDSPSSTQEDIVVLNVLSS